MTDPICHIQLLSIWMDNAKILSSGIELNLVPLTDNFCEVGEIIGNF